MLKKGSVSLYWSKQIFELEPNNKKYLSLTQHGNRIKDELTLRET